MSRIVSIVPKPLRWLVGSSQEETRRVPFGTELRTITVQCIPNEAQPPLSEGGNSAMVALSCGHSLEWERPSSASYSPLEKWVSGLQGRIGHRIRCLQCTRSEHGA
jgi:hypothetical protein